MRLERNPLWKHNEEMEIVNRQIEGYLHTLVRVDNRVLLEMEQLAHARSFPTVGPLIGKLLYQQTLMIGARRVLELGSGFGYSAWWFGRALGPDAELHLTDFSAENLRRAQDFLGRADLSCRIFFHHGDALDILDGLEGRFDVIFNDLDKIAYPEAYRRAVPRLRPGGLLMSDNVLWHGQVTEPSKDLDTRAVQEYNRLVFQDDRLVTTVNPLRDGLAVSWKR